MYIGLNLFTLACTGPLLACVLLVSPQACVLGPLFFRYTLHPSLPLLSQPSLAAANADDVQLCGSVTC